MITKKMKKNGNSNKKISDFLSANSRNPNVKTSSDLQSMKFTDMVLKSRDICTKDRNSKERGNKKKGGRLPFEP